MSKGAETRKRIIATAAPLFNRKGYDGCSMRDIGAATGLEKASLYGHFATKEELAARAFDYAWAESSWARVHNLNDVENSVDKLKLHIQNFVSSPSFPGGCPLLNTATSAGDGIPALRDRGRQALETWGNLLKNIVQEGKRQGEIRVEADAEAIALLMVCLLEGASVAARLQQTNNALEVAQQHLYAYLEENVRTS